MQKLNKFRVILIIILSFTLCFSVIYIASVLNQRSRAEVRSEELQFLARTSENYIQNDNDNRLHTSSDLQQLTTPNEERDIPIDFQAFWQLNPDIHAWITIPGLEIDYPILQSAEDSLFYLNHTVDREYRVQGSIFTQYDNARDFSDPHTIIYGHNMPDGTKFGALYQYLGAMFMASHDRIIIYTPENVFIYRIFAAITYDDRHLLDSFDFAIPSEIERFLDSLRQVNNVQVNWNPRVTVETSDTFITLSTCTQRRNQRLLIIAILENRQYEP